MKLIHSLILATASIALSTIGLTAAQAPVNLGTAGDFAILSKAGISTTGVTSVTGNLGVSPIDATAITGFSLSLDASNEFSSSPLVTGEIFAADYAPPTPAKLTTGVSDMEIAYTDAAGRTLPDATELGAGNVSGMTLAPGLYKWSSGLLITTELTLEGCPEDVWIFQIARDLTVENGVTVHLSGGAEAANVFWQVAGEATIGTGSQFKGILLSQTAIHLNTGAAIHGRLLAQTAVTLNATTVTAPAPAPIMEERILEMDSIGRDETGEVTLVLTATPGQSLTLQDSTDLVNWNTLSTTVVDASPYQIKRATSLDDAKRFYRAFYDCQ